MVYKSNKEDHKLGVEVDVSIANQDFPKTLEELDSELASIKGMPRPCSICKREMNLLVTRNPELLLI